MDIVVCSGPHGLESCPLVVNGSCPAGAPDVVVCNLSVTNPWAASVRAAWNEAGVPVVTIGPEEAPVEWPAHLGAAVRNAWPT